jgi:hypothetical protein
MHQGRNRLIPLVFCGANRGLGRQENGFENSLYLLAVASFLIGTGSSLRPTFHPQ